MNNDVSDTFAFELINHSYELIVKGLTKTSRRITKFMIEQDSLEYSFELITPNSTELNYKLTKNILKKVSLRVKKTFSIRV